MLKYGVFVYSVLFIVDTMIQAFYSNIVSSGIVFAFAFVYLFVNLIRDTDDFLVVTPLIAFISSFLESRIVSTLVGVAACCEFLFLWWFHMYRKNNECTETYLNDCKTSVLLSSSLLLVTFCEASVYVNQSLLISSLSLILSIILFIYTHSEYIMPITKKRYGLTENTEQEELFGIKENMI